MKAQNKKIFAYSASAVCLIQLQSEIHAQAVYIDINPDTILNDHYEMYILDVDGDGHNDFDFYNLSYMHHGISSGDWDRMKQRIFAGVRYFGDMDDNGIVGFSHEGYNPGYGYFTAYSVSNLEAGYFVGQDAHFNPWVAQVMARRDFWPGILSTGDTLLIGSIDYGEWIHDVEDGYIGIKFRAGDDSTHYGWIRCSVKDDGPAGFQLIIKDYAYELTPNAPILAGDTIGGLPVQVEIIVDEAIPAGEIFTNVSIQNSAAISIYSFGNILYVHLPSNIITPAELYLTDMQGRKISSEIIQAVYTEIQTTLPSGLYAVHIQNEQGAITKKVLIQN